MTAISTAIVHMAPLAAKLAEAWFAALWQGLVLVGVVAASLRLLPALSAGRRSMVWVTVLLLLAGTHFSWHFYGDPHGILLRKAGQQTAWTLSARWSLLLAAVWAVGSGFQAACLLVGLFRVRHLRLRATPLSSSETLSQGTLVYESSATTRPCVVGFFQPQIVLPVGLARQITPAELRQVLLHEAEHIRRGDHWLNLLQKLMLVVFPLNPAMLLVERRLCAERELACDDRVMQLTGARKAYAVCLARIAEFQLAGQCATLAIGAWDRRPELLRRVERILHAAPREAQGWRAHVIAGLVVAGALAGATLLARTPSAVQFTTGSAAGASTTQTSQMASEPISRKVSLHGFGDAEMVSARVPLRTGVCVSSNARRVKLHRVKPSRSSRTLLASNPSPEFSPLQQLAVGWSAGPDVGFDAGSTPGQVSDQMAGTAGSASGLVYTIRQRPAAVRPAVVYVVRTPEGWLVLQL